MLDLTTIPAAFMALTFIGSIARCAGSGALVLFVHAVGEVGVGRGLIAAPVPPCGVGDDRAGQGTLPMMKAGPCRGAAASCPPQQASSLIMEG